MPARHVSTSAKTGNAQGGAHVAACFPPAAGLGGPLDVKSADAAQREVVSLRHSVDALEVEVLSISTSVDALETQIASLRHSVAALETETSTLRDSVDALELEILSVVGVSTVRHRRAVQTSDRHRPETRAGHERTGVHAPPHEDDRFLIAAAS